MRVAERASEAVLVFGDAGESVFEIFHVDAHLDWVEERALDLLFERG